MVAAPLQGHPPMPPPLVPYALAHSPAPADRATMRAIPGSRVSGDTLRSIFLARIFPGDHWGNFGAVGSPLPAG